MPSGNLSWPVTEIQASGRHAADVSYRLIGHAMSTPSDHPLMVAFSRSARLESIKTIGVIVPIKGPDHGTASTEPAAAGRDLPA